MWDKIFTASMVIFFAGMLAFLLGGYLVPDWSPVTTPIGAVLAGSGGIAAVVSGLVLVLVPGVKA